MDVLIVMALHGQLGNIGHKGGLWFEEFLALYFVFRDVGAVLNQASPKAGQPLLRSNV